MDERYEDELTYKQESYIRKSLKSKKRRECINEFCENIGVSWGELSKEDASQLIDKLNRISWYS